MNDPYIPSESIIDGVWCRFRERRAELLAKSDWTQTRDCPLSQDKITEWAAYRQSLRDTPSTQTITLDENNIPSKIVWPVSPDGFSVDVFVRRKPSDSVEESTTPDSTTV
jgi:hypothetical protein